VNVQDSLAQAGTEEIGLLGKARGIDGGCAGQRRVQCCGICYALICDAGRQYERSVVSSAER